MICCCIIVLSPSELIAVLPWELMKCYFRLVVQKCIRVPLRLLVIISWWVLAASFLVSLSMTWDQRCRRNCCFTLLDKFDVWTNFLFVLYDILCCITNSINVCVGFNEKIVEIICLRIICDLIKSFVDCCKLLKRTFGSTSSSSSMEMSCCVSGVTIILYAASSASFVSIWSCSCAMHDCWMR